MSGTRTLPRFDLGAYRELLHAFQAAGWALGPVSTMPLRQRDHGYIRHDVDFHLAHLREVAELEAALAVSATYYVLLTGPYNALRADNRARLEEIVDLGHEVGLHYDLVTYPSDPEAAMGRLRWELDTLAELAGTPVRTICMHQPTDAGDVFRSLPDLVHPHDPRWADDLVYVSDSCRGWRDETLLQLFGADRPERFLLNTHAELWLAGSITDRMQYLRDVVLAHLFEPAVAYVDGEVRPLWERHPGGLAQDRRDAAARH